MFTMLFMVLIYTILVLTKSIDLSEDLPLKYDNKGEIFVTNNHMYNSKYYVQEQYLYSLVNIYREQTCFDSCLSWVNKYSPFDTVAITGFDIHYINQYVCECKGQVLKRKIF